MQDGVKEPASADLADNGAAAGSSNSAQREFGPAAVTPADRQYKDLVVGLDTRYVGTPDVVNIVGSVDQIAPLVQKAVDQRKRITVRSGGHCLEGFVFESDVKIILDVSKLQRIYYDKQHKAIAVECGATLLETYETLYEVWGITIPAGICAPVGVGGHIAGGGWGLLCRQHGLSIDHLYGVEVVTVDQGGHVRTVVATRERDDPNRDLWWAHTGGGGGNFGVVTRYLFRSPNAKGNDPRDVLPKPPTEVLFSAISWPWDQLTEDKFGALMRNYGAWHVANRSPDNNPTLGLASIMMLTHKFAGQVGMFTQVDATLPNARQLLDDYQAAIAAGVNTAAVPMSVDMGDFAALPMFAEPKRMPWLQATRLIGRQTLTLNDPTLRADYKSAYMRSNFTDHHIAAFYKYLTRPDVTTPFASVTVSPFAGKVSAVAADATAFPHRGAAFKLLWGALWTAAGDDEKYISWLRQFYGEVYSETGGVPVPNEVTDGCYVNYPDIDLNDPRFNTSQVPWHDLYYKGNYPRLQQVKKRYDPRNVFHHGQSVELPG